jgi:O-antigen ligase
MEDRKNIEAVYFIPIILLLAIVPIIVVGKRIEIDGLELLNWRGGVSHIDFFSYYKALIFIIVVYSSLALLFVQRLFGRIKFKVSWIYIPLLVYIVMVIISTYFSEYLVVSWRGFMEQFQGVWVLVGYAIAVVLAYNMVSTERDIRIILFSLLFSGVIIFVIGFTQYFGYSVLELPFMAKVILPLAEQTTGMSLKFKNSINTISATMYNQNFVGSYAALLFPLTLIMYMYQERRKNTILVGLVSCMMFFILIGSKSRAGYVGTAFSLLIMVVMFRKVILGRFLRIIPLIASFIVIVFLMNHFSNGSVLTEFDKLDITAEMDLIKKPVRFEDIRFNGNSVNIVTENESLKIRRSGEGIKFMDDEDTKLTLVVDELNITFEEERYSDYRIEFFEGKDYFKVFAYKKEMIYFMTEEGLKLYDIGGTLGVSEYPRQLKSLVGRERLFSGRGFIWMDSIPLLEGALVYGYGPGMYPIAFPQQDYAGKLNMGVARIVVDKPHDMYLQIGIENGVIALIALLILFAGYFFSSVKTYRKDKFLCFGEYAGFGIFLGITGYLVAGIFNDQIISVAPIFYVLLGAGFSLNEVVRYENNKVEIQNELDEINGYSSINDPEITEVEVD